MIFLVALATYWLTLCPTVYVGDSGELSAAAHTLGIAHPTGYPLYLLLARGFSALVPAGSVAVRLHLFSALCAALAAQVLARVVQRLGAGRLAAWSAGLSLAWCAPIWTQATVARVYPLAALGSALALWFLVRWWQTQEPRHAVGHNLVVGLALANHTMAAVHLPAFLLAVLLRRPAALKNARALLLAAAALLPGLSLYAYLPLRAAANPAVDYRVRVPADPAAGAAAAEYRQLTDPAALRSYLLRESHHERRWARSAGDFAVILRHQAATAARELTVVGTLLLVLGAAWLWRQRSPGLAAALLFLWLLNGLAVAWHGAWWDVFLYPRYLTTGWVALLVLVGAGLEQVRSWVAPRGGKPFVILACLALPAVLLFRNFRSCDRSDFTLAEDYARALLAELPPDSQFYSMADAALFPVWYLQVVEGVRTDVELVNPLHFEAEADLVAAADPARRHEGERTPPRPFYTTDPRPTLPLPELPRQDVGLLDRVLPLARAQEPLPAFEPPRFPVLDHPGRLDEFSRSLVVQIHANTAEALFARGDAAGARDWLERAAALPAGRCWGYWAGVELCLRMGEPALGRRLLEAAERHGDPRDPVNATFGRWLEQTEKGLEAFAAAEALRGRDPERQFEELERAARLARFYLPAQKAHALELAARGRREEAVRALEEALSRALPGDAELLQLRANLR